MNVCRCISKAWKWIQRQSSQFYANWISIVGIIIIICQLHQAEIYKKYDNFLYFNHIYSEWYNDMPEKISENEKTSFSDLDGDGKAWVRRYFNLYSEEYYFYREEMIPKEMWNGVIHGCKNGRVRAAFRNLQKYPALLQGYCCWKKEEGAFGPEEFVNMLDAELKRCGIDMPNFCGMCD